MKIRDVFVDSRRNKTLKLILHKRANSIEIFSYPTFSTAIFTTKCTKSDAPADSVLKQATQILLNHAEISMIMCNIYNSIPASHLVSLIISFEFVYMKMKVEF